MNVRLLDAAGRVLFLSGAAGGIGRALTARYIAAGGKVAAFDTRAAAPSANLLVLEGDASDEQSVAEAVERTLAEFGRIDSLVHAAGAVGAGPLADTALADWEKVIDANLTSAFLVARAGRDALDRSGGAMVLLGSSNGRNGGSALSGAAYAAAKAAIANLGRYLAKEWAPRVRVNTVAPGPVRTPMLERLSKDQIAALEQAMPTGRLIEPDEVAAAIAFLLSDHARSITGATLNQSGGLVFD